MAIQTVFSNNLDPQNGSLTSRFINATAFYIDTPLLAFELEIDVFLQVYFPTNTGEQIRNLRLGSLFDGEIKLNETDTETVVPIPSEFLDSGLEMALFFLPSEPIFLEVFVIGVECTLCQVQGGIFSLIDEVNELKDSFNNISTILNLILNSLGVTPPTIAGTTDQQDFFFLQ